MILSRCDIINALFDCKYTQENFINKKSFQVFVFFFAHKSFRFAHKRTTDLMIKVGGTQLNSLESLRSLNYFRPILLNGSFSTPKNASPNIPLDIFDVPASRSTKIIDSSPMRKPSFHAVYFISIWNP